VAPLAEDLLDILGYNLKLSSWRTLMERLNLNVPAPARAALKRLAQRAGRREAELARDLLLRAIEQEEREEFFQQVEVAMEDPALRKRLRAVTSAMEKLRGASR
jgi:hypothetical protein